MTLAIPAMNWLHWCGVGAALMMVVGVILALLGRRGRRIDDHPICRKCGYDLTGRPESSTRCAECGADLMGRRAIRIGHRERRRGLFWIGVSVMFVSVALSMAFTWRALSDFDPTPYKPVWLLRREASSTVAATRSAAFEELKRRLNAGIVSTAQMRGLVSDAFRIQRDAALPWRQWGDLTYAARMAGKISDEDWTSFARQSMKPTLTLRPRVRAGDPFPIVLGFAGSRLPMKEVSAFGSGPPPTAPHLMEIEWLAATVAGFGASQFPSRPGRYGGMPWVQDEAFRVLFEGSMTSQLAAGTYPVTARIRVHMLDSRAEKRIGQFDVDANTTVTILPAETPIAELFVTDPAMEDGMRNAITTAVTINARPPGFRFDFRVRLLPAAVFHHGYLRLPDGREIDVGIFHYPTRYGGGRGRLIEQDLGDAQETDLVLKPDLDSLLESSEPGPVWGGELVFHLTVGAQGSRGLFGGERATTQPRGRG